MIHAYNELYLGKAQTALGSMLDYAVHTLGFRAAAVPLDSVLAMYSQYHEMDLLQFYDEMDARYKEANPETNLKRLRKRCSKWHESFTANRKRCWRKWNSPLTKDIADYYKIN